MYMKRMLEIGKVSNGYIVECCVPLKSKKSDGKPEACCTTSTEKQYVCKDAEEVTATINKLFPLLDEDFTSEKEFDTAFDEAAKGMKGDDNG